MKSMFWGIIFLIIGVVSLVNYTFGIHLPIFKIIVALGFVYFGLSLLMGSFNFSLSSDKRSTDKEAVFATSQFQFPAAGKEDSKEHEYSTVFGESRLDLSNADYSKNPTIEINSVFGSSRIVIKKGTPLRVQSSTAFGKTSLPENNMAAMGQFSYVTPGLKDSAPALNLRTNAAFGSIQIVEHE